MKKTLKTVMLFMSAFSLCGAGTAFANLEQVKTYQKAFDGDKPKCVCCHVDKLPKKEDGKHDLNEYGLKVKAAKTAEMPDEETYKTVGPNESLEA